MSSGKVKCTCGWSWNKSDSSKKDMYICHECGRDNSNNMKNGGWLDTYANGGTMQEHQENYNDPQVSLPEGFVGMGNNTKGRNYSPAWGGQFQMGGNIYPVNYVPQAQMGASIPGAVGFSYARVGAPSKGPRRNQTDVTDASAQNGQEMKFYQEGLDWQPKTISKNGGWLNKYDVAQAGAQVEYGTPEYEEAYNRGEVITDEGVRSPILLDEVVVKGKKREKGFWEQYRDKIIEENKDASILGAIIGTPISAITSLPQLAATYAITGKVQRPSEAIDIQNPYGAMAVDAIADPANLVGLGLLTKEKALAELSNLKNINSEGKIFNGVNKELNNIATKNIENYMSKRVDYDTPLPKELEPYISRVGEPSISREEEVFRNVMGHEYRDTKELENTIHLDSNGNIISNPDIKKPNLIKKDLSEGNNIKYEYFDKSGNKVSTFSGTKDPKGYYVNSINVEPQFRRKGIASDIYKNIAKDLQSKNEGTLLSRSTQHQFTDKDELGRSIAPANKLWENLVNKREAEKFIEGMSHSYKMKPLKEGGIIKDDMGQWDHPGEITEINSNDITMQGVPYDVLGISDEGDTKLMKPGKNYKFKGKKVTEYPMAKNGIRQEQKGLVNLDQLTNFTNYNKPQPGGWLDTL